MDGMRMVRVDRMKMVRVNGMRMMRVDGMRMVHGGFKSAIKKLKFFTSLLLTFFRRFRRRGNAHLVQEDSRGGLTFVITSMHFLLKSIIQNDFAMNLYNNKYPIQQSTNTSILQLYNYPNQYTLSLI